MIGSANLFFLAAVAIHSAGNPTKSDGDSNDASPNSSHRHLSLHPQDPVTLLQAANDQIGTVDAAKLTLVGVIDTRHGRATINKTRRAFRDFPTAGSSSRGRTSLIDIVLPGFYPAVYP